MTVNGKQAEYVPVTLLDYLRLHRYDPARVVVERGREIITQEHFGDIMLLEHDEINILQFMGGG